MGNKNNKSKPPPPPPPHVVPFSLPRLKEIDTSIKSNAFDMLSTYTNTTFSTQPGPGPPLIPLPGPPDPPDPPPQISATCSDYPYNKLNLQSFDEYINSINYKNRIDVSNNLIDFEFWRQCILTKQNVSQFALNADTIDSILNKYNIDEQNKIDTANESNNYSMTLYQNDIYYTYAKIVFFIILICSYIYFFRITGIIEPIKELFNFAKTKLSLNTTNILSTKIPGPKPNEIRTNSIKNKNSTI
jgi:hypothetical protein